MKPQEQQSTSFELPAATPVEQLGQTLPEQHVKNLNEVQSAVAIEQGVGSHSGTPQGSQPVQLAINSQANSSSPSQADDTSSAAIIAAMPQIADDTDLIEKEWVVRAKEIVSKTAHDPHLQNKEMNKFKADYLKKRYNKEVKLSEDT